MGVIHIFTERLLHLMHCPQIGNQAIRRLLATDPHLENLYKLSDTSLQANLQLNNTSMTKFLQEFHYLDIKTIMAAYRQKGIIPITFRDAEYPDLLKEIYDSPLALFTLGDIALLRRKSVAVVGARTADTYADSTIRQLATPLVEAGIVIVSGLARGADTLAHRQTIELGGKTIAVLAGGFYHLYPRENTLLAETLKKHHLLVSEYPPIWKPRKWHFPMRNRIISGITLGTVIVQAKSRSGSLITADFALEFGREVFAVPGPIHAPLSQGTNWLIQQGAKLVTSGQDILDELMIN